MEDIQDPDAYFKCMVCFELCNIPVECLACHKLMCCEHVRVLNHKCPGCGSTPFKCQTNIPIQNIIEGKKQKLPVKCGVKACQFKGVQEEFVQHAIEKHPQENDLIELRERKKRQMKEYMKLQKKAAELQGEPKNQEQRPIKKEIMSQDLHNMKTHIEGCQNAKCYKLWTGKWGYFIGGQMGGTHFDLTQCVQGKQLNEKIGWDYDNPNK